MDITDFRNLNSWIDVPAGSDFPLWNLPFGIMSAGGGAAVAATRIGDTVADLDAMQHAGLFDGLGLPEGIFRTGTLNGFIALGRPVWRSLRARLTVIFTDGNAELRDQPALRKSILHDCRAVKMLLPVLPGDYTDFYSSIEHATNVGVMFRDPANALLPNWRHGGTS